MDGMEVLRQVREIRELVTRVMDRQKLDEQKVVD